VIDSICGSAPDVKRVALFTARHGGPLSARGFKAAWARAMRAYMAAGGARFREDDIRVKRARDASSFRHQQENPGREELSRGERPDRANVVKVTPLRCLDHEYLENERDIW
jgi:hypothetical protein